MGTSWSLGFPRTKTKLLKNKLKKPSLYNIELYKTYINICNKLKRTLKIDYYIKYAK